MLNFKYCYNNNSTQIEQYKLNITTYKNKYKLITIGRYLNLKHT